MGWSQRLGGSGGKGQRLGAAEGKEGETGERGRNCRELRVGGAGGRGGTGEVAEADGKGGHLTTSHPRHCFLCCSKVEGGEGFKATIFYTWIVYLENYTKFTNFSFKEFNYWVVLYIGSYYI